MPSQPPPGSTGGSPRILAPFQPAPDSTGGSPRTPAPGSTGGIPRIPELSAQAVHRVAPKCPILVNWCLEKVEGEEGKIRVAGTTFTLQMGKQMREGASSSKGNMAHRVFRSSAIVKRLDDRKIESEDGYSILIHSKLNIPKTHENGFSQKVCRAFECGFPRQWQRLVNPKMVPDNEHATSAPSHSVEYYKKKFSSDSFSSSITYDSTEDDLDSFVWYSGHMLLQVVPKVSQAHPFQGHTIPKMQFCFLHYHPVCRAFECGFLRQWQRLVNPKMVPDNEHATSAPSHSVEYYKKKFSSDSFSSSITYDSTEDDLDSFVWYSGHTDGLTTQSLSNLLDDNAGNRTASWGLYDLGMDVPEKPLAPPGEACNSGQESYQHESTHIDASKQKFVNSQDADIQQDNMHSCSSEHGMVTLPIDSTSSQQRPKCGKDLVNLGTTDALELPTEGMTPKFGAIGGSEASTCKRLRSRKAHGMPSGGPMKRGHKQKKSHLTPHENVGSEDSTCKRLRSGKVRGMPSGGPMKRGHKQKKIQQMVNQGATSTADLASYENGFSAAEVAVEEKMESHALKDEEDQQRGR